MRKRNTDIEDYYTHDPMLIGLIVKNKKRDVSELELRRIQVNRNNLTDDELDIVDALISAICTQKLILI